MIKENLPLFFNDKKVGKVFEYQIVGSDNFGFPIVCINGELYDKETLSEYPEYRYTRRVNQYIEVVGIE